MSANHHVAWEIDNCNVSATFHCDAPEGTPCRTWCVEGCEEQCFGDEQTGEPHRQGDHGECLVVLWLNNDDAYPYETFNGRSHRLMSGPIVTTWDGDGYEWDYDHDTLACSHLKAAS